jgi:hypothetical protein
MGRIAVGSWLEVEPRPVKTMLDEANSGRLFFEQVAEFCQMAQDVFLTKSDALTDGPTSGDAALAFAEVLLLCPTADAARSCIRKDLIGALSFVMALQGVKERIQRGSTRAPSESPQYQTKFYLLACAVQDYMDSLPAQAA